MMKINATLTTFALAITLAVSANAFAQQQQTTTLPAKPAQTKSKTQQTTTATTTQTTTTAIQTRSSAATERLEPDETSTSSNDISAEAQANRREQLSEEQALIAPYYNNFFKEYRIGPEDIISIYVFNQERYSRANVTVPPSGKISYPLIPEGVLVNGRTTEEVQELIKKRLDEYIIDPEVSVSVDKAMSYRYSVLGDVAQPGVKLMGRRMTVVEALVEAGGVLNTGDKKKVYILRKQSNGMLAPIVVNVAAIERGRAPDSTYLVPGDQVVVPGNRLKTIEKIMKYIPILSFARIFTGGGLPF